MCSKHNSHLKFNSQHIWGGPKWPLNEHENLHFDNEQDMYISSKNFKESGYDLGLVLQIILY